MNSLRVSRFTHLSSARIGSQRWLAVLGGIIALGMIFGLLSPAFFQIRNLQNILLHASATGILAIGMTFVIMTAGIDISVGANLFLAMVLATEIALNTSSTAGIVIIYAGIPLLTCLLGFVNGVLIDVVGINPFITTLATLSIYRGAAIHVNKAIIKVTPDFSRFLGIGKIAGIPVPIFILVLGTLAGALVLKFTRFGRYALAIGSSSESAIKSGLPVRKVVIAAYSLAGLCAGIGGLVYLGRTGIVQPAISSGMEFTVITAVILGGTSLTGGRGSLLGSLLGAVFLVLIDNGLNLIHASEFIYDIVRGGVLIGAILIDRATTVRLLKRR